MKFIRNNKEKIIIISVIVVLMILIGLTIYQVFGSKHSLYGNRLKNAVTIDETVLIKAQNEISKLNGVTSIKHEVGIKTIKFFIDVDITSDKAKKLVEPLISNLSEKVLSDYDIEVYITNDESKDFPMIGYHSKNATQFTWVLNKAVAPNEK